MPSHTSAIKVNQARVYGARVLRARGPRSAATVAAQIAAQEDGVVYASQLWHPAFVLGVQTLAFELWEQSPLPDAIVVPLGAGTLLLGIERGFQNLHRSGLIPRMPRFIGVQVVNCAPIAARFGWRPTGAISDRSIAEGIQVADPPRASQIVQAIERSGGTAIAVEDEAVRERTYALAREGVLVEPTAAVAVAGLALAREQNLLTPDEQVVAVLTGSGLKTIGEPTS